MLTDEKIYVENNQIKDALIVFAQSIRPTHKIDIIFNTVKSEKSNSDEKNCLQKKKVSL